MAETDPELGTNLMVFFLRDWDELLAVPDLDRLIGDIAPLVGRLGAAQTYRTFRFDNAGAIKACFSFVRMGDDLAEMPADAIALSLAVQAVLLWAEDAFADRSALVAGPEGISLRPEIAALIRAAYDPVLPAAATDPSMRCGLRRGWRSRRAPQERAGAMPGCAARVRPT
jgi:hypothetical protein